MRIITPTRNQGSMLIITVCTAAIIGAGLVSYLWLIHSKNRMVSRSLYWNVAMAHAEAGVEEALAQLNHTFGTNVNRAANGWFGPNAGIYGPVDRTNRTGRYIVTINSDAQPLIRSTGYATNPISGDGIARTVEVRARVSSAFQVGMAAKLNITFKGNNVHIDSFDSEDPAHDDPLDPNEIKANGDVASTDGFVDVGNANINGKIKTGPGGSYSFGSGNGYAGPVGWTGPGLYSPEWYQNDFNAEFKDVDPPFSNPVLIPSPTSTLVSINGQNATNYWDLNGLNGGGLNNSDYYYPGTPPGNVLNNLNIVVSGNVRLWVTGDFKPNTSQTIFIGPNASLKLYVGNTTGAPTSAEFGNVNTTTGSKAAVFQYFGLPNNTSVTWGGNQNYKGTVYAPNAVFTMGGSGQTIWDYQGACVVKEVVLNGHFNFHYDEDLKRKDPYSGYVAGAWREK